MHSINGRNIRLSVMRGFLKSWYIMKGKVLVKACTISVWNNDGFMLGAAMLAWTGRIGNDG